MPASEGPGSAGHAAAVHAATATAAIRTREPRRPSGFPEFDRFSAEMARTIQADQERARKVEQARAEGRPQISAAEAFPPDPREPPEVVRFTLAPGGRICRVAG